MNLELTEDPETGVLTLGGRLLFDPSNDVVLMPDQVRKEVQRFIQSSAALNSVAVEKRVRLAQDFDDLQADNLIYDAISAIENTVQAKYQTKFGAMTYERLLNRLAKVNLRIDGRDAVEFVAEEKDELGVVVVEQVDPVSEVKAVSKTAPKWDWAEELSDSASPFKHQEPREKVITGDRPNPLWYELQENRAALMAVMLATTDEVKAMVKLRDRVTYHTFRVVKAAPERPEGI